MSEPRLNFFVGTDTIYLTLIDRPWPLPCRCLGAIWAPTRPPWYPEEPHTKTTSGPWHVYVCRRSMRTRRAITPPRMRFGEPLECSLWYIAIQQWDVQSQWQARQIGWTWIGVLHSQVDSRAHKENRGSITAELVDLTTKSFNLFNISRLLFFLTRTISDMKVKFYSE